MSGLLEALDLSRLAPDAILAVGLALVIHNNSKREGHLSRSLDYNRKDRDRLMQVLEANTRALEDHAEGQRDMTKVLHQLLGRTDHFQGA